MEYRTIIYQENHVPMAFTIQDSLPEYVQRYAEKTPFDFATFASRDAGWLVQKMYDGRYRVVHREPTVGVLGEYLFPMSLAIVVGAMNKGITVPIAFRDGLLIRLGLWGHEILNLPDVPSIDARDKLDRTGYYPFAQTFTIVRDSHPHDPT